MATLPSSSATPNTSNKSPRKPTCAVALDVNLEELKRLQGLESLRPYVVKEKCFPASVIPSANTPITIDELKKLARAWKLNERRNFWKTHTSQDQLVEVLRKHIQDTINPTTLPPVKPSAEQGATTIPSHHHPFGESRLLTKQRPVTSFKPTFQTKDGEVRTYCGHRLQNKIRNSQDIVSRSRHFAFPDETNNLLNMIYNWRAEDFSRHENEDRDLLPIGGGLGGGGGGGGGDDGNLSMTSLSMTSSKLETQAEQMRIQTSQRNKLVKQRALAIHLLQFTISSKFSASSMDRKSLETFLDVGESADPDILMNSALAISNLSSHPSLRPILLELNCVHRYSSFLPLLVTPHTSLGGGLFLYYMSCETEVEDRLCSAGFKTLQKNSLSDNFQLRIVTLQCLSNLMPCQERIRVAEQVVSTLHQLYRDYLDETWNEEILQVLLRVTSFPNCLRAMMEADVMDIISLAAAEVRDNISCGRLIARILSHFLHQLDLGEDLIHADFSRIFIDLLSLDDLVITELCMHAFAVMSSHELLISSVADSDIVHIVCGFIASTDTSLQIQIVEDIARYLCNICQPSSKVLEQRVHDGAAHALLDLFRLCPNNDHIQRYAIIGLRDLLTNLNNCQTLASLLAPALLEMLKLNVEMSQKLDVNVVQCVYNLCLCSECHDYLLLTPELQVDVVLYKILTQVYQRESVSVIKALLQVLIILADMEIVVFRLISHGILEFLVSLVEFSVASETKITSSPRGPHHGAAAAAAVAAGAAYKECWNDVSRLLLVMIHSQPQLTPQQENSIVKILPLIGTKSSSEEIISDCAVILAFLSFTLQNFTAVDPIVRSIIHLSESDNVMDATSTVLYNISCSDLETSPPATATPGAAPVLEGSTPPPPSMLLSDGMLHVNMMIKMMRNGNIRIQQNIAETMKLLCIHARCNELLLRNDLLSDFIVIALLRTNSPTVKKVCSEAFYNMLCHHSTRKRLLSGDLWWAMMRLSKTDLSSVRMICAKAVYNLTCDPLNVKPLRNNYILSFIKEIAFEEEDQEYQDIFLHVLHRIVSYALESSSSAAALSSSSAPSTSALVKSSSSVSGYHEPLNHTEMVAVIQILINALSKSKTIDSSQWIGYLLATIAKECLETKEINEFIHMDLISMLKLGSGIWLHDMVCRRYFSTVLSLLCSQYSFTNATLINDLLPVLSLLMNHEEDVGRGVMQPLPLDQIICEDICSVLYSYAVRQQIDIITMISIPFFPTLMTYALTGVSPYKQHLQRLQSSSSPYSGPATTAPGASPQQNELESTDAADAMEMETNAMVDEPVTTLCALFLKLLVFVLPKLFDPSAGLETRMTSSRSLYSKKSPAIEVIYKVKSSLPMRGFLNIQLYLNDLTRNNTLYLLQTICSSHEEKVRELLQLNYFMLLHHLLTATPLPSSASYAQHKNLFNSLPFLEFCSVFLRNVSAFPNLHPLLVQSVDLDAFLMALVKYKDDILLTSSSLKSSLITKNNLSLSSFETDSLHRLYDITVMLYHLSLYRLYPSSSSPSPSSTSASGGGGRGQHHHVITPSVVLNIISEVTSHANGDHLLSHITKLIIGLVVDKTEDGNGFDPSFIREILTEINDENSLDEQQIAEFMKPKLQLQYLEVDMGSLPPRTVPRRPLEVLSKEEIDALWVPLVSSQRKKMEYFPMIAPAATGGAGGAAGALAAASPLSIDPVLPFPMATYDKIIQRYPFVTEPVLLEAKREREEKIFSSSAATARGAGVGENGELLGVLEEEIEDFPNMTTAEFEERHGLSPGSAPLGPSAGGERAEMASPIPPSPATSSYPLSPRPPDAAQRSTPNMKSAGRLLVQSKGASASSIQRNLSNDSAQSPARKRTTSS